MVVLRRDSYPCVSFEARDKTNTAAPAARPTTYLSCLLARTYIQVRHSLLGAEIVVCNSNSGTQLRAVREENLKRKWNNLWDERGDNRIEDELRIGQGREIKEILRQREQEENVSNVDKEEGIGEEENSTRHLISRDRQNNILFQHISNNSRNDLLVHIDTCQTNINFSGYVL